MTHRAYQIMATIGVLGMTMAATYASAVAATSDSVALSAKGDIQARGAGITVAVTYSCPTTEASPSVGVQVSETVRGGIAGGFGGFSGSACDGKLHTVTVPISAQPGGKAFATGPAFAIASLSTFNPITGPGPGAQTFRTIALSK
jgi:hypothetical protein